MTALTTYSRGGTISDNGAIVITPSTSMVLVAPGSEPKTLDPPGMVPGRYFYPEFLPNSEDLLFFHRPVGESEGGIYLASLRAGVILNPVLLMKNETAARFTPAAGGRVLYVRNDNLYGRHLNRSKRVLEGDPELIVQDVASQPGNDIYRADFSVARNGTVAWRPGKAALAQITVLNREGMTIATSGPPGPFDSAVLSPDGKRLLVPGSEQTWVVEVGQPGRMALANPIRWMSWSGDGAGIFGLRAPREVVEGSLDGSTPVRVIAELSDTIRRLVEVSPDGTTLLATADRGLRAARLARGTAKPTHIIELVNEETPVLQARFSPDARSIVYVTDGLYVQPFPGPGRRQQIAPVARFPVWRGDSKEILYLRGFEYREVWSVAVRQTGGELTFSPPQQLFGDIRLGPGTVMNSQPLAVSPDGSRIFVTQAVSQPDTNMIHVKIPGTTAR